MYSLFIAYENDEWCRFVVHIAIGSPSLISFYCVCFVSFYLFLLFVVSFVSFFVPRFLRGVSKGELLQFYLVINVTGLVEPPEPGSV